MKLVLEQVLREDMFFTIRDKVSNKEVGELEILSFPGFYTIACKANDNFGILYRENLDDKLAEFFAELKSAIMDGAYELDLNKQVYLNADEQIASRYAIVNCLVRIPRYDGYYFI